ncbi:hypothetical protein QAD02_018675 [Eretmocerus hayati]|uniref:Uncharacterized protein n=1 Tax=Eretmocerus hayati TaxID=131215 RepID=A0ACC2PHE0_9HYME|nr:hypothetical protein QAD02_018675 [Eretmocerus hayati]
MSVRYEYLQSRRLLIKYTHEYLRKMCDILGDPRLQEIIRNPPTNPPYDAVLVHFIQGYQCFTAIGHVWNVPVIGVVTAAMQPYNHRFIGNPLNLALVSKNLQTYKENMNFWGRLYNFIATHFVIFEYDYYASMQDEIIKKHLGQNIPHYTELEREVALLLTHSHPSLHGVQPKTPAHVEIGGIHIQERNSTIDLELKKLLDESENGFVFFSFGTITVLESLPKEVLERFFTTFRKIAPMRVIMKSKNATALPRNIPRNVFTYSWLPQQKILQHPNIKGFISHGGGLGSQEAVYFGVPMICVPFFADQFVNCDISLEKGYGVKLDIKTAQQADYDNAFAEILKNPRYRTSVKRLSMIYRDRSIKPKDEAVYWIEYVIRHGKQSLRSPAVDLKWWQIELFDVYALLVAIFVSMIILISLVVRKALSLVSLLRTHLLSQQSPKKTN